MSSQTNIDIKALKTSLLERLPQLIECLFPDRKHDYSAHEYRIGTHGSISIRIADGVYFNHESSEGGDLLSMIAHQLKTDFKGALAWASNFLGDRYVSVPAHEPKNSQQKLEQQLLHNRKKALAILNRSIAINNTLAEYYLNHHRKITVHGQNLMFDTSVYNYGAGGYYPALVAAMRDINGNMVAAHCTYLNPTTGDKLVGEGVKPRLIFGRCRGAAIHLTEATDKLAICEGIEDGLSIMQCKPEWSVWVSGGTSNLRAIQLPKSVKEVMICADNDDAGKKAAKDLATRLIHENKQVRIATPPDGVKDFNDLLRLGGSHV